MNDEEYQKERKERWFKYHSSKSNSTEIIDELIKQSRDWKELSEKLNIEDLLNTSLYDDENFWKCFHARRYLWAKIRDDTIMMEEMVFELQKYHTEKFYREEMEK